MFQPDVVLAEGSAAFQSVGGGGLL